MTNTTEVTLRSYPKYLIKSNGTIVSKRTGRSLSPVSDTTSTTVRLTNRNGKRVRVPVATLVQKAFAK
jgi:hypothetical protein